MNDDILGFIHGWVEKLSRKLDKLYVVCLSKGEHHLPQNIEIFSLGKERGYSKLRQLWRLEKFLFKKLPEVDGVFAHMCPIYAVASIPLAKIFRKKIVLWYAHYKDSFLLKLASLGVDQVVTSIKGACKIKTKTVKALGQGIDTERFKPDTQKNAPEIKLLFLGRVTPVKNLEILIEALSLLEKRDHPPFILNIVGEPSLENYRPYFEKIKERVKELNLENCVNFLGKVPHHLTQEIYSQHDIFINLTASYSFDKTTLEAMASGLLVLVSNRVFEEIFPESWQKFLMFQERDAADLAKKLFYLMKLPEKERDEIGLRLREIVVKDHNLDNLVQKLSDIFYEPR